MKPPRPDAVGSSLRTRHDGQRAKRRKTGRGRPSRVERGFVIRASHGCGQTGWPDLGTNHRVRTLAGGVFGRRSRANGRSGGSRGEVARRVHDRMASNPVSFVSVGALPSGRGHGRRVRRKSGRVFGRCSAEDGHDSLDRGREAANLHERLAPPASFAAGGGSSDPTGIDRRCCSSADGAFGRRSAGEAPTVGTPGKRPRRSVESGSPFGVGQARQDRIGRDPTGADAGSRSVAIRTAMAPSNDGRGKRSLRAKGPESDAKRQSRGKGGGAPANVIRTNGKGCVVLQPSTSERASAHPA